MHSQTMNVTSTSSTHPSTAQIDYWFETVSCMLSADKFNLQTGIAPDETTKFYNAAILGNTPEVFKQLREGSNGYFVRHIIIEFVKMILSGECIPKRLAFSFSDSKIFIWAEIKENDEAAEDAILMAEAKINGEYYNIGFNISATIIEDCDNLKIPPHYITIPITELLQKGGSI